MGKLPKATIARDTPGVCTVWFVEWPSTPRKWGKSYYATTYPNSELIYVETAAKRRKVADGVATKLKDQLREAINRARAEAVTP